MIFNVIQRIVANKDAAKETTDGAESEMMQVVAESDEELVDAETSIHCLCTG